MRTGNAAAAEGADIDVVQDVVHKLAAGNYDGVGGAVTGIFGQRIGLFRVVVVSYEVFQRGAGQFELGLVEAGEVLFFVAGEEGEGQYGQKENIFHG